MTNALFLLKKKKKKNSWDEAASRSQAMKEQLVSNNIILWDI